MRRITVATILTALLTIAASPAFAGVSANMG